MKTTSCTKDLSPYLSDRHSDCRLRMPSVVEVSLHTLAPATYVVQYKQSSRASENLVTNVRRVNFWFVVRRVEYLKVSEARLPLNLRITSPCSDVGCTLRPGIGVLVVKSSWIVQPNSDILKVSWNAPLPRKECNVDATVFCSRVPCYHRWRCSTAAWSHVHCNTCNASWALEKWKNPPLKFCGTCEGERWGPSPFWAMNLGPLLQTSDVQFLFLSAVFQLKCYCCHPIAQHWTPPMDMMIMNYEEQVIW